jgi:hypothetical protein
MVKKCQTQESPAFSRRIVAEQNLGKSRAYLLLKEAIVKTVAVSVYKSVDTTVMENRH